MQQEVLSKGPFPVPTRFPQIPYRMPKTDHGPTLSCLR